MKDLKVITLDEARIDAIVALYDKAGNTAQQGFEALVVYSAEVLGEHTNDEGKVAKSARTLLMHAYETDLLDRANLSKSYLAPALTLAYNIASDTLSTAFDHIMSNFCEVGKDFEDAVTDGALFTPARLAAGWGKLAQKKGTIIVEVTPEGLMFGGKPWHTLTIAEIKRLSDGKSKDPRIEDIFIGLLGNSDNLDKQPGAIVKLVEGVRTANEGLNSEDLEGLALRTIAFVEDERVSSSIAIAQAEADTATAKVDAARDASQERIGVLAEERAKLAEAITLDDQTEVDEQVDTEVSDF